MQSRLSSSKRFAALAVFAFALLLFPTLAFASTSDASGDAGTIDAQAIAQGKLAVGGSELYAQDSNHVESAYPSLVVNKTYSHTFTKYNVIGYRFTSGGGNYTLVVNNMNKSGYMVFGVWLGKQSTDAYTKYLAEGAVEKGKNTFKLGTIKKGTAVNISINSEVGKNCKCTFIVKGKAASGSSANQGGSKKATKVTLTKSNTTITVKKANNIKWTGKALKPKVTVKYKGKTLKKSRDYKVKYANNVNVGKGVITIEGKGNYKGMVKKKFTIKPKGYVYALVYGAVKKSNEAGLVLFGNEVIQSQFEGSAANVSVMKQAFDDLEVPGYKVKKLKVYNKSTFKKSAFVKALKSTFGKAKKSDLCFVYLNAQGAYDENEGVGLGVADGSGCWKYGSFLKTLQKKVKGTIVFMPEMCFSGGFVDAAMDLPDSNRFVIISSTSKYQPASTDVLLSSFITMDDGVGIYTRAISNGLTTSDADGSYDEETDGKVTVRELHTYTADCLLTSPQIPALYPASDDSKKLEIAVR